MFNYVYIITNLVNKKQYVGERTCSCDPINDNYLGSGKLIKQKVKEYGKHNFKKEILEFFPTKQEAFDAQEKYIKLYKTHVSQGGYNKDWKGGWCKQNVSENTKKKISNSIYGHRGYWNNKKFSEEHKTKIGLKSKGRSCAEETKEILRNKLKGIPRSAETKQKIKNSHIGLTPSAETRKKLSESHKGIKLSDGAKEKLSKAFSGENHPFFGKTHSDETKIKIGKKLKGKTYEELYGVEGAKLKREKMRNSMLNKNKK